MYTASRFVSSLVLSLSLSLLLGVICVPVVAAADSNGPGEFPPAEGRSNLAAGKAVSFSPKPNYRLTAKGDTDATDLTDGKTTQREDREIWRESGAVGWSYGGRVNLAVDLGRSGPIDEVAMRLCGRTGKAGGVSLPSWVEVLVSDDGEHYRKVGEISAFDPNQPNALTRTWGDKSGAWIHCLRFKDLHAKGRWVGIRLYGGALTVSDELYVFGKPAESDAASASHKADKDDSRDKAGKAGITDEGAAGFTVTHAQPYFHKPYQVMATNVVTPLPVGVDTPDKGADDGKFTFTLETPKGIDILGGKFGDTSINDVKPKSLPDGGKRYRFTEDAPEKKNKRYGRLYVRATGWSDGQTGAMHYHFSQGDWKSGDVAMPVRAVAVPQAPRLKKILVGLGWWTARGSVKWPHVLDAWQRLGLNSFPMIAHYIMKRPADSPSWQLLEKARQRGFKITNIDSTISNKYARKRGKKHPVIYCQFEDGSHSSGRDICPSYRGKYYQQEIARFAKVMARVQPDSTSQDIELWGWRGPEKNAKRCTRCQAAFAASGYESWDKWLVAQGDEMWRDMIEAARKSIKQAGGKPDFDTGGYNFRPGHAYQKFWSVDHLYPKYMDDSQVSTYTALFPDDLRLIGDEARKDRSQLPHSDVLPWLSPGDAGTFPGEAFQWALLECYANGSRGVWFWSNRVWDAESLIAYNRVVRAIAPVENLIIEGKLAGDAAKIVGKGRVSGIRRGKQMMLLVADYARENTDGAVKVRLNLPGRSEVTDLLHPDAPPVRVEAGVHQVAIPLNGARARLLLVKSQT